MTNRELIQLLANKKPEVIAETFDKLYCWGWNDGARGHGIMDPLTKSWLDEEYNKDFWKESDIKEVLGEKL